MSNFVDKLANALKMGEGTVDNANQDVINKRVSEVLDHHLDQIAAAHGSNHGDHHYSVIL